MSAPTALDRPGRSGPAGPEGPGRIYLTGFMGAGKSSVGRLLAERLAVPFVDLDLEIEREAGRTVAQIFAGEGEAGFRRRERCALERTLDLEHAVVATGGGAVVATENRELIAGAGIALWLKPRLAILLERLERLAAEAAGERPLLGERAAVETLYRDRLAAYETATIAVEIAPGESAAEVAGRILALLPEGSCAT